MKKFNYILKCFIVIISFAFFVFLSNSKVSASEPDFNSATEITFSDNSLYVGGVEAEKKNTLYYLSSGNYKLTQDITIESSINIKENQTVNLDLNGYELNFIGSKYLSIKDNANFSVYDNSRDNSGKITSTWNITIYAVGDNSNFNLYSGTIECKNGDVARTVEGLYGNINLYGGKVISKYYAIKYVLHEEVTVKLVDVILEADVADVHMGCLPSEQSVSPLDISEYFASDLDIAIHYMPLGESDIVSGVRNQSQFETIDIILEDDSCLIENFNYDSSSKMVSINVTRYKITQMPTYSNDFTIETNGKNVLYSWYKIESVPLTPSNTTYDISKISYGDGVWNIDEFNSPITAFNYNLKQGDIVKITLISGGNVCFYFEHDSFCVSSSESTLEYQIYEDIDYIGMDNSETASITIELINEKVLEETSNKLSNYEEGGVYRGIVRANNYIIWTDIITIKTVYKNENNIKYISKDNGVSWLEIYNISFNSNGGTGTMTATEYVGNYTLPANCFTAPEGKHFKGWATSATGNVIEGNTYNVTSDTTLYAIWEENSSEGPATPEQPENNNPTAKPESKGLGAGAIVGIVMVSLVVLGTGGFAVVWFIVKKKTWSDFIAIFRKK